MPSNPPPRWPAYRFVGWFTADSPEPQAFPKPHHDGASGRLETIGQDGRQVTIHVYVSGRQMREAPSLTALLDNQKRNVGEKWAGHMAVHHPSRNGKVAAKK